MFCSTEWPLAPGIWNKDQIAGWKKVTDAVHGAGAIIYAQVGHHRFLIHHFMLIGFYSYGMVCN
jgi:2,4-dienoyl-CoA reductase-like NADH-dependent reductase (Old Yellow Enzyme family)